MKLEHKRALRCFILEKLKEVTCVDLAYVASDANCTPFEMAEQFEVEVNRIEKLFCYPNYSDDE
jgi:hypothetical protein